MKRPTQSHQLNEIKVLLEKVLCVQELILLELSGLQPSQGGTPVRLDFTLSQPVEQ